MTYTLRLVTPPSIAPVTLAEAKEYLGQDLSADDALISRLINAATAYVETATGRALILQTWTATFGEWPRTQLLETAQDPYADLAYGVIGTAASYAYAPYLDILKLPAIAVTGVTAGGAAWTAYSAIKTARGLRVTPNTTRPAGEIVVTFTAGYGATAADVPFDLQHAILKLVATAYEHRGALPVSPAGMQMATTMAPGLSDTLARHRVIT